MEGFDELGKFKIAACNQLSPDSSFHIVYLQPSVRLNIDWMRLQYQGYECESQLGQHLSLTICNKSGRKRCTRLYTSIWCMRPANVEFMERCFPNSTKLSILPVKKLEIK